MGSFGLHALKATTGTAKKAAAATVFSMRKSLAGDRDYHARRLLGQLGEPRLDGRLAQFAHLNPTPVAEKLRPGSNGRRHFRRQVWSFGMPSFCVAYSMMRTFA